MEHFTAGAPLLAQGDEAASDDGRLRGRHGSDRGRDQGPADTRIRPAVARTAAISCSTVRPGHRRGVPSHARRLLGLSLVRGDPEAGVENMLRHYVPEVTRVEAAL